MLRPLVLALLAGSCSPQQPFAAEVVKTFKIDRITNCEASAPYPVYILPGYTITYDRGVNAINCTLRIDEQIDGPMKYVASIKRCEMDLTKCEFFNEIEAANLCGYFGNAGFQEGFLNNVSPRLACPVQPGDYRFNNNRWDMTPVVNLPGSAYRWNVTATVTQLDTGRVVYCLEMMARIVVTRKKRNRNKQRQN